MSARRQNFSAAVTTTVAAALLTLITAGSAQAQYRVRYWQPAPEPAFTIAPYFGYSYFGHYEDGPLGSSRSGSGAALTGVQANLTLTPYLSLVGNVAYANTGLAFNEPNNEPTRGNSGVWLYDGGIQMGAPFRGSSGQIIRPFLQLGAGAMNYTTQNQSGNANATNFAFNYGVGLDYPFSKTIGMRLMLKDYVAYWNNPQNLTDAEYYYGGAYGASEAQFTHNIAITAGLKLAF